VRTWLVVVGAAIAVIGGGLFASLFVISGGPQTTTRASFDNPNIPAHKSWPELIERSTTISATIGLTWSTNVPANVSLTAAGLCSNSSLGVCPYGPPLFAWTGATSGKASGSTGNATAFILLVQNPGTNTVDFAGTVSVSYTPVAPFPTWAWGVIALGGVVLLGMGGIALFLGLFLPSGVYRDPPGSTPPLRPPPDIPEGDPPL